MELLKKIGAAIFSFGMIFNNIDMTNELNVNDISEKTPIVLRQDMGYRISLESHLISDANNTTSVDKLAHYSHRSHSSHSSHSSHYSHRSHYSSSY